MNGGGPGGGGPGGRPGGGGPTGGPANGTGGPIPMWGLAFDLWGPNKGVILWNRSFNTSDRMVQLFW
jgi:hypothetical protein